MPAFRGRNSIGGEPDDITHLSLAEVRERLSRNERVLATIPSSRSPSLASSPITPSLLSTSPLSPNNRRPIASSPPERSIRERLMMVRKQLKAREEELMVAQAGNGIRNLGMNDDKAEAEGSWRGYGHDGNHKVGRSGKQRAMELIEQNDRDRDPRSRILPLSQSLALGERDYDNQTAIELESLSLEKKFIKRNKPIIPSRKNGYSSTPDEISEAQQAARLSGYTKHHRKQPGPTGDNIEVYGRGGEDGYEDDDDMFDMDEKYHGEEEREYDGNGMPSDPRREEEGQGIERDYDDGDAPREEEDGGGMFAEGNDEYGDGNGLGRIEGEPDDMGGKEVILGEK